MRVLAIDHGSKRIGLAVGDTEHGVATPLKSCAAREAMGEIPRVIQQEGIGRVVIGLPLTLAGEHGSQVEVVKRFARELSQEISAPAEFFDERLTTKAAWHHGQKDPDASAAALLLNDWFEAQK